MGIFHLNFEWTLMILPSPMILCLPCNSLFFLYKLGGYGQFAALKTYNRDLKTLIAIGGWNEGSKRFSPLVASSSRRKTFIRSAIRFLR